jgi:hypothetical protein
MTCPPPNVRWSCQRRDPYAILRRR